MIIAILQAYNNVSNFFWISHLTNSFVRFCLQCTTVTIHNYRFILSVNSFSQCIQIYLKYRNSFHFLLTKKEIVVNPENVLSVVIKSHKVLMVLYTVEITSKEWLKAVKIRQKLECKTQSEKYTTNYVFTWSAYP